MHNDRHMKLLQLLQEKAPNASAQQKCADFYNMMVSDGCSDSMIELNLLRAMVDGEAWGELAVEC